MAFRPTQNWDSSALVLRVGQATELNGYRCAADAGAITCTVIEGAAQGKGFVINAAGVTPLPPP